MLELLPCCPIMHVVPLSHKPHRIFPSCPCAQGVEFWAVNTDSQALAQHAAFNKVQIGTDLTRGLGCGGNPGLGEQAAWESEEGLRKMLQVRGWEGGVLCGSPGLQARRARCSRGAAGERQPRRCDLCEMAIAAVSGALNAPGCS